MKRLALLFLLAACVPQTAPKPTADYAALPDSLVLPAGAVRVELVDSLAIQGRPGVVVLGRFNALERTIYISRVVTSPQQRWKTAFHEICHAVLLDNGMQNVLYQVLDPSFVEMLCDAFATQRMAELSRTPR